MPKIKVSKAKLISLIVVLFVIWAVIGYFLYSYFFSGGAAEKAGSGGWLQVPGISGGSMFDLSNTSSSRVNIKSEQEMVGTDSRYNIYNRLISEPRFYIFKSYSEWPIEIGKYGKPNPFTPFDYKLSE